jgi:crotonobetainyl-CoA:carnitine CoA-transferase CaiB-like acyl-CoA transferase
MALGASRGGPLEGLVIVELAGTLAGELAGGLCADLGATVVKVEPPTGSPMRRLGAALPGEDSFYFQSENRGKLSACADLAGAAPSWARRLVAQADAVVEDWGPGGLEALGLAPAALEADNPQLCVLRISPFGQTGPLAGARGDDRIAQAFSGVQHVTGFRDRPPIPVTVPLAACWTGAQGANGLLIALLHARRGGRGQVIDLALYETALRMQEAIVAGCNRGGPVPGRVGNESPSVVPANIYRTRDGGWIALSGAGDAPFARLCEAIEQPDAPRDPRFATMATRLEHRAEADALVGAWVAAHDLLEVEARFISVDVAGTAVRSVDEILASPHVAERGALMELVSTSGTRFLAPAPPQRYSRTPAERAIGAPRVGEHTEAVRAAVETGTLRASAAAPPAGERGPAASAPGAAASRPSAPSTAASSTAAPNTARSSAAASSPAATGAGVSAPAAAAPHADGDAAPGALAGLRVLDLSQWLAGPAAAAILADFGADVIMIELPAAGEPVPRPVESSLSFVVTNRNKRSVALDIRTPAGRAAFLDLVRQSDAVVENFRPGTLERYKLGPEELLAANPRLVVLRASGFGQTGPYAARSAFNPVALALGGVTYLNGWPDRPPLRDGVTAGDYTAALFNVLGLLGGLVRRERDGLGQVVDVAMYEAVLRMTGDTVPVRTALGVRRERAGGDWPLHPAALTAEAADGRPVAVSAGSADELTAALERLGAERPAAPANPREALAGWIASRAAADAVAALRAAGLGSCAVNSVADVLAEPHAWARGNLVRLNDPRLGEIVTPGVVPTLSRTPGRVAGWPALPGADSAAVLGGVLGYDSDRIRALTTPAPRPPATSGAARSRAPAPPAPTPAATAARTRGRTP